MSLFRQCDNFMSCSLEQHCQRRSCLLRMLIKHAWQVHSCWRGLLLGYEFCSIRFEQNSIVPLVIHMVIYSWTGNVMYRTAGIASTWSTPFDSLTKKITISWPHRLTIFRENWDKGLYSMVDLPYASPNTVGRYYANYIYGATFSLHAVHYKQVSWGFTLSRLNPQNRKCYNKNDNPARVLQGTHKIFCWSQSWILGCHSWILFRVASMKIMFSWTSL